MNQLQQDLQNELTTTSQLLKLISVELQKIKIMTNPGGEFEKNIIQNASLMKTLANLLKVDLEKITPFNRNHIDLSMHSNQDVSYEQHNTFRNDSGIEDCQQDQGI